MTATAVDKRKRIEVVPDKVARRLPPMLERHWAGRSRIAQRAAEREGSALRLRTPLIVRGVRPGKLVTIGPNDFHLLDVDRRYQRDRINSEVNDLIEAVRLGGYIPDPVSLVKRLYAEDGQVSRKLWIVDGQQRVWAHLELDRPIAAMVYEVESIEAERSFFVAMQAHRAVASNAEVYAWGGTTARTVREAAENPAHPMCGLVWFRAGAGARFCAAPLVKALLVAMTDRTTHGGVQITLERADYALNNTKACRDKAEAFLRLLPAIFTDGRGVRLLQMVGIAAHASKRWKERGIHIPEAGVLSRIRKIHWSEIAPGYSMRQMPMVAAALDRAWP